MPTHKQEQPWSATIHTRRIGRRNWAWRVCDFFYVEIERGDGCLTRDAALVMARIARDKYLASVVIVPLHLVVTKKKARKRNG